MFKNLLVDTILAQHYNSGKCVNYRDQRSLCAPLLDEINVSKTSGQSNLTEVDVHFKEIKAVCKFFSSLLGLVWHLQPITRLPGLDSEM